VVDRRLQKALRRGAEAAAANREPADAHSAVSQMGTTRPALETLSVASVHAGCLSASTRKARTWLRAFPALPGGGVTWSPNGC